MASDRRFEISLGDKTNHRRDVAEAALAHTIGGTEGAYRHETALEKRRRLMQRWAHYLSPKGGHSARVVGMMGRAMARKRSKLDLMITAIHEAGHAVAAYQLGTR
jgi:hypothetical protein